MFLISGRVETNSEKGCFRSRDVDFCGIERVSGGWREVVVREREVVIKEREVVVREWEVVIKEREVVVREWEVVIKKREVVIKEWEVVRRKLSLFRTPVMQNSCITGQSPAKNCDS